MLKIDKKEHIKKNDGFFLQHKLDLNTENSIYYPSSRNEWCNSIYSYNKSYVKSLVVFDAIINKLIKSYFNMVEKKAKVFFKRRRSNKSRYSANKIYISKAELKHTNNKLVVILYAYNKQKLSIEEYIRRIVEFETKILVIGKRLAIGKKIRYVNTHKNKLLSIFKNRFFLFKKWKNAFLLVTDGLVKHLLSNLKQKDIYNTPIYNIINLKKAYKLEKLYFDSTKLIAFNKSKFNNLLLNLRNLGLINFIQKIYNKKIEIKLVELKSIHLNSDVFSSAVALKLRDRKNKVVSILRKAVLHIVKIPDLHTLITFDDNTENINKNNILETLKQQVVSGVRFEAKGRLTRRLTAQRAVYKHRYTGSLKDIRSSLNNKSSIMLRGYVKPNSQYTIINSKTRNGTFGLKGWVSSH